MKKNSNYWIKRIANETYKTYNSLEDKNRALIDMFQEATLDIENELYTLGNKINSGRAVTLSDMHKYNRLTNLKKSMEDRLELLTKNVEEFGTTNMVNGGKKVYDNVIGNIADTSFSTPNQRAMEEMLNKPWNGSNFSKRLWKNTQVLANNLNDILTIGLTQGKTLTELAVQLRNRMNKSFNECHRLVRTETMHYLNESAFKAYKDGGCEEVELYAAEDERTCEICGAGHGKRYKINKRPILPFHPNCRCTYLPVINVTHKIGDNKNNNQDNGAIKEDLDGVQSCINKAKSLGIYNVDIKHIKNPEVLEPLLNELEKLKLEYGQMFNRMESIDIEEDTVAQVIGGVLQLNQRYFNDKEILKKQLNKWNKDNYIPANCNNIKYIITHEYMHLLTQDEIDNVKSVVRNIYKRADKKEFISKNAVKDPYEFAADLLTANRLVGTTNKSIKKLLKLFGGD